jgi:hypothetical protein
MEFTKTFTLNLEELRIIRNALLYVASKRADDLEEEEIMEYLRLAGFILYE